jgi:hypothetical protein
VVYLWIEREAPAEVSRAGIKKRCIAEFLAVNGPGGNRVFAAVEQVNPYIAHVAQQLSDRGDTSPGAGRSNDLLCGRLSNADPSLVCITRVTDRWYATAPR